MILKLVGALIGLYFGGFIGAAIGWFIGSFLQSTFSHDGDTQRFSSYGNTYGTADSGSYYSSRNNRNTMHASDNPRTLFLNSLLEISAYIIAIDDRIMHSEMEVMRTFLRQNFDSRTADACNKRMLTIFEERKRMSSSAWRSRVMRSCYVVASAMQPEQRLQLLSFLASVVKADGHVDNRETEAMRDIALALGLDVKAVDQLFSLGGTTLEDAYKVLGIPSTATDDEVRRAYRKMALQYHPDRVATLGNDVKEAAKRKFQEINDAKERIYKARGL